MNNPTEIKKALYKYKPKATLVSVDKEAIWYNTMINLDGNDSTTSVMFKIPLADIGDAKFTSTMDAQLLIAYLIIN